MIATDRARLVLPTGTVTFLFSDIEGSTRLLRQLGDPYAEVLAEHRRILRAAFAAHNGVEIGTEGDSFFVAFARASDAVAAAAQGQRGLEGGPVRVRMGLHTGEPMLTAEGYVGMVVHRAARIAAVGHGGQVLLSEAVATLVVDRLPVGVSLRDLGKVRLKDLTSPEQVFQILHSELQEIFPALRSLEATPNNLPQQVTSFIGREREMAELEALLVKTRILTLTGAGGVGKTRLSLQVAAATLDKFPDGAWLVELAPLTDPALVAQTVATVLGLREAPGTAITQTVVDHLKTRQILLLLDNCEHLLFACVALVDMLVQCPDVAILATSREALGITGEQISRVPSLSLPDRKKGQTLQSLSTYESVRLFIDRALAVRTEFTVTNQNAPALASVCCRLDGIPLAVELAAARVRALSVEEIDHKLDERFRLLRGGSKTALPRQQTLRALIDWSYDLLHDPEKLLLQRLSVFAGGWTLDAAEAVCAGEAVASGDVLDLLTSLVDKSLVFAEHAEGHTRFRLLETVRQYAREKLVEAGPEQSVRERHRDHFLAMAEQAEPKLMGAEQAKWLKRLEDEHENLRAGFEWTLAQIESGGGLRFCGALQRFWITRGHFSEGREWCVRALDAGDDERTPTRAKALNAAGQLAYFQGDYPVARAQLRESLAIRRALGDRKSVGVSLNNLGNVALDQRDYPAARALYEECVAIMRELSDQWGIATSLHNLATVAYYEGDNSAARKLYEEGLAIAREVGDRGLITSSLHNLGSVAYLEGDYPVARELYEEALAIRRELVDLRGIASALQGLGEVVAASGDSLRAACIWGAAERLRKEIEAPLPPNEQHDYDHRVAAARLSMGDDAAFDRAGEEGRALTLDQAMALALNETVERP